MREIEKFFQRDSDQEWERWGRKDPFYGILTNPRFRSDCINSNVIEDFFETGVKHVEDLKNTFERLYEIKFAPRLSVDFGCGVGRVVVPLTGLSEQVIGIDVSASMLNRAKRFCLDRSINNVEFIKSVDDLSKLKGQVDFIHSMIVFQHISTKRGVETLIELLKVLQPGGLGALHFTYSRDRYSRTQGKPWEPMSKQIVRVFRRFIKLLREGSNIDPEVQMNSYDLNQILHLLQENGVGETHIRFSDHGGYWGALLFFRKHPEG